MSQNIQVLSRTIDYTVLNSCASLIAAFFPGKNIHIGESSTQNDQDIKLIIDLQIEEDNVFYIISWIDPFVHQHKVQIRIDPPAFLGDFEQMLPAKELLIKTLCKRAIFLVLEKISTEKLPWGILMGIRPGKLLDKMQETGYTVDQEMQLLRDLYLVDNEKALLLQEIQQVQKPHIQSMATRKDRVSVYLSIPFCPTRCYYCSFPSNLSKNANKDTIQQYIDALLEEVSLVGNTMNELKLKADNIYIGGGTPTILDESTLHRVLRNVQNNIPSDTKLEYTVEAGRADTINKEKLLILKEHGVNRLSVNPQTMQNKTLRKIGREHTCSDVVDAYYLARSVSNWNINMDLILGLSEEGFTEIQDSLQKVLELHPDNITIHALALKRGSMAWEKLRTHEAVQYWQFIQDYVHKTLIQTNYIPYYLYRQKYIVGNLENIGYTIPGKECRYNIGIIEEKQNVIGLGVGASNKIQTRLSAHQNIYHSCDLAHYQSKFHRIHVQRAKYLREEFIQEKC